jgi:3D-(3,5/4)-trihydroxycyclohexane-1,2-dione acylhydrolase (decyclizing)
VYPTDGTLRGDEEPGEPQMLPVDLAANARSLGARVLETKTYEDFVKAYQTAKANEITTVVYVPCDRYVSVPGYDSWWDVPVAEVSEMEGVRRARSEWEQMRAKERLF